ncbi:MAG TPA: metallophosphoesterase family protein [Vicinamibacterales bacterium]|nr:metallophosphoesterase family protein [Vicinamibacterales bacterium]
MLIGLISDTHGVIRPEALAALNGVEMILHAGDVGSAAVLRSSGGWRPFTRSSGMSTTRSWDCRSGLRWSWQA